MENNDKKTNVIISALHRCALEAVYLNAIRILAESKNEPENSPEIIDLTRRSINEFISELEKFPFTSKDVEIYRHAQQRIKVF